MCVAGAVLWAQPDPRQMSGIPRPDPDLADGLITVRVIRGSFVNNVPDHPVELLAGDTVSTAETDAEGRAAFTSLSPGLQVRVATTLDGERLVSQPFATPARGGVAVLLVGVTGGGGGDPTPSAVARPGRVTLGQDSRILIELGEETIEVYYLLDVLNVADTSGRAADGRSSSRCPSGALAGTVLQGSIAADHRRRGRGRGSPVPFRPAYHTGPRWRTSCRIRVAVWCCRRRFRPTSTSCSSWSRSGAPWTWRRL